MIFLVKLNTLVVYAYPMNEREQHDALQYIRKMVVGAEGQVDKYLNESVTKKPHHTLDALKADIAGHVSASVSRHIEEIMSGLHAKIDAIVKEESKKIVEKLEGSARTILTEEIHKLLAMVVNNKR